MLLRHSKHPTHLRTRTQLHPCHHHVLSSNPDPCKPSINHNQGGEVHSPTYNTRGRREEEGREEGKASDPDPPGPPKALQFLTSLPLEYFWKQATSIYFTDRVSIFSSRFKMTKEQRFNKQKNTDRRPNNYEKFVK